MNQSTSLKEGDIVEKGQVLLRLDNTRSLAILRESENKVAALTAMAARLRAEATGIYIQILKTSSFGDNTPKSRSFFRQ